MLMAFDYIIGLLSPHICKNCGAVSSTYCERCILDIVKHNNPICLVCGRPCKSNNLCSLCKQAEPFDGLITLSPRIGSMKRLVGDYKYNSEVESARILAKMLAMKLRQTDMMLQKLMVVPVPTVPAHVRARGFDHMLLVAKGLSKMLRVQMNNKILDRSDNLAQHSLSMVNRRKLIKKSLILNSHHPALPDDAVYLVLDDIWTTGSTMRTAAELLHKAGAKQVVGVVITYQPAK